ncbi:ribonuclease BN [Streptomyces sp. NPDC047022]|uniref:ribonuclease BN n=1 Tax=Streptomyces sp. NPDC047022 TaxID=3155737 RepID=UPI0034017462
MSRTPGPEPPPRGGALRRGAAGLWSGRAARLLPRLLALNVLEGAIRLAAQAFLTALPLLMTVAAFAPHQLQQMLSESLAAVLGLHGQTLDEVRRTYFAGGPVRGSVGGLGALLVLLSATAFTRALQAVCERCWSLARAPIRSVAWRWLLWLIVWLAVLLVQAPLRSGFGGGPVPGLLLSALSSTLLWWWSQHLLLGGRIGWPGLLPGAVLAGAGTVVLSWGARLVMPTAMQRSLDEFGPLGPVFTFQSWLISVFLVAVSGLALGATIASSAWYGGIHAHPHRVRPHGPHRAHAENGTGGLGREPGTEE